MDIRVPINADAPSLGSGNVFIVTGDRAQVVMGDNTGALVEGDVVQVAPDYAELALAVQEVANLLRGLDQISPEDVEVLEESAADALAELAKPRPDRRFLSRVLAALRGSSCTRDGRPWHGRRLWHWYTARDARGPAAATPTLPT